MNYADFYRASIDQPESFWAEQAQLIDWQKPWDRVCDNTHPPFSRWFVGGQTNLCHNAVDRHAATHPDRNALIWVSTEVGPRRAAPSAAGAPLGGAGAEGDVGGEVAEKIYTFAQLQREVECMASMLLALGVKQGDRVLVYMPMIPEAVFAMLACARIGAIHSVVFGGFASVSLASRIEDAQPTVIVSADAGSRAGKVVPYKGLLDEAIRLSSHKPAKVLLVDRGLAPMARTADRDVEYTLLREQHKDAKVPCAWLDATHPSYTLYTSGTTGKPKGVQRDTGGYAVALAASMKHIFLGQPGETYFSTSDIGWVVGHSYIVYGPLIGGMATILYEGLPIRPDAGIWWSLVERFKVTSMFSAPTAVRVLKKHDPAFLKKYDVSSLRALFLAGEPLDEPTAKWIADSLGRPIIDNYWQTETGWPILSVCNGIEKAPSKFGSPGKPVYGFDVKLLDENTGEELKGANQKGVVAIEGPLPPGCMQTVWRDDARFVSTYWSSIPGKQVYSTFDWGIRDEDGYFFILGRTDDVINVAGHRLGTREIEESISSHANVAEVAVVGVADPLKGQVAMAFVVLKTPTDEPLKLEGEIMKVVDQQLGAVARPSRVRFVTVLPKTRSGKMLRRAIQAVCEGRDPGDLTTIEDPSALQQIKDLVGGG
jgi:propionyl-CoA synthetase